jgi:hypothetical protein
MATTITATAATVSGDATLNGMRDRVRDQVEAATGRTEPLVVTASSIQLNAGSPTLRDRVESLLQDSGNSKWSTDDTDEAIRRALEVYSQHSPVHALGTIALSAAGREISLASLTGLMRVEKVWWDYDSTTPGYPPNWRQFEVWPGSILYIDDRTEPANGDTVRVWYTKMHTINGLDSASATTVPQEDVPHLIAGAAQFAAEARAIELSESLNVDKDVVARLMEWADEQGKAFRYGIKKQLPAWQRYATALAQENIDEAIRWALHRYNLVEPNRAEGDISLSADGREISLSSLTGLQEVERVWCDYDSSDPEEPPNWREFEVWPGSLLYIKGGSEPQNGDTVRVFYTKVHTLNGLDGAGATTFGHDVETLLVVGASGFAAQERTMEQEGRFVPTKLRLWAEERLKEFERGLKRMSRREGVRHSGIAPMGDLDRWEGGWW